LVERLALSVALLNANQFHIASVDAINSPLPIQLISFAAVADGPRVRVDWETASEINNDFFSVERSADGEQFMPVGVVKGAGTTSRTSVYRHFDEFPMLGVSYYRLRQTDIDGTYTFSGIQRVVIDEIPAQVRAYPNPVRDGKLTVQARGFKPGEMAEVRITDLTGRVVTLGSLVADTNGQVMTTVDLRGSVQGLYLVQLNSASVRWVEKVVVH
jgi:hypothetical protein